MSASTDYGTAPSGGWAPLVCELLVEDLEASLAFWRDLVGFRIAYQRPEDRFVYLERRGAQIMLHQRCGVWETGPMQRPFGRGVMFQLHVEDLDPLAARLAQAGWPLHTGPREVWRRTGEIASGAREIFVQDPDGYLVMLSQGLGERPPADADD